MQVLKRDNGAHTPACDAYWLPEIGYHRAASVAAELSPAIPPLNFAGREAVSENRQYRCIEAQWAPKPY